MEGKLYVCPTPIGNLEDITLRVLRVLKEVDLILAEDTRHSLKLLNHYDIKNKLESYHEHNEMEKSEKIISLLKEGKNIALISDAGMPGISDPGEILIKKIHEENLKLTVLPGPSAMITALVASGQSTKYFAFEGFLPRKNQKTKERLELLKNETRTIILYESPYRVRKTLKLIYKELGDRKVSLCRELTKKFEEIKYTTIKEEIENLKGEENRGEFVIIIEGRSYSEIKKEESMKWKELPIEEHIEIYYKKGFNRKKAMKKVAEDRNVSKRKIYNYLNK